MIDTPWDTPPSMDEYLQATRLIDLGDSTVQETASRLMPGAETPREAAIRIYNFCRDEIEFGYNRCDAIPASQVLSAGCGQCNTKSILLVTLLRAANIPARFHLAQVSKAIQWGVMSPLAYLFAPDRVTHTWAEVNLSFDQAHNRGKRWNVLEGAIMDKSYFLAARRLLLESGRTMGYAIGLPPEALVGCASGSCIDWDGNGDVTSQMTAVVADFGPAADSEEFYCQHTVSGLRGILFERRISQEMTGRAERIRRGEKL